MVEFSGNLRLWRKTLPIRKCFKNVLKFWRCSGKVLLLCFPPSGLKGHKHLVNKKKKCITFSYTLFIHTSRIFSKVFKRDGLSFSVSFCFLCPDFVCHHKICWRLSTVSSVRLDAQRQVSWKYLSHLLGLFSIMLELRALLWSTELTQSLWVVKFLCRCY